MQDPHFVATLELISCMIGLAYGAVLIYGLKQQWHWLMDPPEWTSVIYFPTVVKMIWGPKHVRLFAYLTAYGTLIMSFICLVQSYMDAR